MPAKKLHFIGIGGHTMRGLAWAAIQLGYEVSGTDEGAYPPGSDWLDEHQITWWREADPKHLEGVDALIISGGIQADHPELTAAQDAGIPVKSYAQFVGELAETKRRIVVAGTHGKTTTTSLVTWLLESAGRRPDFLIGIQPHNFDTSVRLTDSPVMVLEGDEYKASAIDNRSKFAFYRPDVMLATSLEMDHPDLFKSVADIRQRFESTVKAMPKEGRLLYWAGSPELAKVAKLAPQAESYGEDGLWHAGHIGYTPEGLAFDLYRGDTYLGHFRVPLYGSHNVDNSTAAISAALGEGLTPDEVQQGLDGFRGASRRFDFVSAPEASITVIDDYAHHPTEIAATITAAKQHFQRRVIAIVRPHTYSRVQQLLDEYRRAVSRADICFVTEIEGARESGGEVKVSAQSIVPAGSEKVFFEPQRDRLIERIVDVAKSGDVILSMTVSGYDHLAETLAERLKSE